MSIKVTIHNYIFPIHFSYKGWSVKLEKKMALFKDIVVEATFTPPQIDYNFWHTYLPNEVRLKLLGIGFYRETDYNKYVSCTNSYASSFKFPQETSFRFSANGGVWDRFWGQNISATDKVIKKITEWMDANLPTLQEVPNEFGYMIYLKQHGISDIIMSIIREAYSHASLLSLKDFMEELR